MNTIEERLNELKEEYKKGLLAIQDNTNEGKILNSTVLKISGAIEVLELLLKEDNKK